ncbi:MAG TPA: DUF4214 domain-containing protein, partial [Gemmata sp.]|nr:DUF4214 domain-containing protein [Gemmata sp.]
MGFFNELSLFDRLVRLGRDFFRPTPKCRVFIRPTCVRLRVASLEDRCLPSSGSQAFLSQVYLDLLNRSVDSSGMAFWSGELEQETAAHVVLGIETSLTNEYQSDEVNHMYETLLNRPVDAGSLGFWVGVLAKSGVEKTEADIAGSAEFFNDAGGTDTGFISLLYHDLLKRNIDPTGAATYGHELAGGMSRSEVAFQVLTSTEYRIDLVESYYSQFLDRPADPAGLRAWVGQLGSGMSDQEVIADIIGSTEFSTGAPSAPTVTIPAAAETVNSTTFAIQGTAESGSLVQIFSSNGNVVGSEQLTAGTTN